MATVKFFGSLRETAGASSLDLSAATVGELLDALCRQNEALRAALFDGAALKPFVRVMVNGRDIELDQGLATAITEPGTVAIFPPIAGGSPLVRKTLPNR